MERRVLLSLPDLEGIDAALYVSGYNPFNVHQSTAYWGEDSSDRLRGRQYRRLQPRIDI